MNKDDFYRRHLALYMATLALGLFLLLVFLYQDRSRLLLGLGITYTVLSFIGIIYFLDDEEKNK